MLRLWKAGPYLVLHSIVNMANTYQGHISRDCTAPNGGPLGAAGKTCYKCGQPGHISKDCTAAPADGTVPAVAAAPAPVDDINGAAVVAPIAPTPTVA